MSDSYLLFILNRKANGNTSPIKCRISDTHLFSLLQLMKTVLYRQTFDQEQRKQNQRNKTDQHLSTGCLQSSGLSIRGHAMLSHVGLPPEREILEYAWQMEIILGKISARLTTIQVLFKNFYLQIMEDEYNLARLLYIDKAKWIFVKLKYDVLRFSLDSINLNLIEVINAVNIQIAPIRLCMCNMHTSLCNENLNLKVRTIQIRQLLRLYLGSWLEDGSISIPELRINAKLECHPPTPTTINKQLESLR
ncbi:unnamed protein product [Adineta steineri]|uniref:Uncharacterized protein n=1 Tax=Adineta steineri TaxID=433720 RepID=A0A814X0Q6_9BILA|nr:unnamed protein product [Adineta steineri]CAF1444451.1 unnamed protein product [Adineta steineri]